MYWPLCSPGLTTMFSGVPFGSFSFVFSDALDSFFASTSSSATASSLFSRAPDADFLCDLSSPLSLSFFF